MENINVWRVHTNTDANTNTDKNIKESVADYCIRNNCICLGWSLKDEHLRKDNISEIPYNERKLISIWSENESFEKYEKFIKDHKIYGGKVSSNIVTLKNEMKANDLVWMRKEGIYFLGIVGENSKYYYNSDDKLLDMDASNQRTDITWIKAGDESEVPGVVTTAFIMGRTLQRINQEGVLEFSQYLVNEECLKNGEKLKYDIKSVEETPAKFFNLISPNDCEDLVCMWLYKKYGYIPVPSTSKISTQLYECVLLNTNKENNREVYIQVKKAEDNLYISNYTHLRGEVFLFTTMGTIKYKEHEPDKYDCNFREIEKNYNEGVLNKKIFKGKTNNVIYSINKITIYNFVMDGENDKYLPKKIIKRRELLRSYNK